MKRVAVIAVHGVGSPPPFSTARAVAELLMKRTGTGAYASFDERFITIPTARLDVGTRSATVKRGPLGKLRKALTNIGNDRTAFSDPAEAARQPDIAFMREQLRDYESPHTPYETIEISGNRTEGVPVAVHVFEMHWADLSRLGNGLLRVLGALYQLVLHVSHLGRKTIDVASQVAQASGKSDAPGAWKTYATLHAWAIRIFTTFVPVATLIMLAFLPFFVPAAIAVEQRLAVGIIAVVVGLIVGGGILMYFHGSERNGAGLFVAYTFAVIGAGWLVNRFPPAPRDALGTALLVTVIAAVVGGALWVLLGWYNHSRPGVRPYGMLVLAAILGFTWLDRGLVLDYAQGIGGAERVRLLAFVALQLAWSALMATWGLLWLAVAAAVVSRIVVSRRTSGSEHRRAVRAIWTARVTLAVAVFSFIVASLVGYRSMVFLADKAAAKFDPFPHTLATGQLPIVNDKFVVVPPCTTRGGHCARDVLVALIARAGTSGFMIALAGCAVSLIMVTWFIGLVSVTAIKAPNPVKNSRRLGLWMTQGFWWMRTAGSFLAWALLVGVLVGLVVDLATGGGGLPTSAPAWIRTWINPSATASIVGALTFAVLASAATWGTARLRLDAIATKARPAIGIMLDVDNYLRESPTTGTPRARIAERFVSLLRYVATQRFDSVLIVSHSQGTAITADLLRFLKADKLPEAGLVTPDRVQLVTMGSPLRQLYAANFPHLYEWVDRSDDVATAPDDGASIAGRSPDPTALNVGRWINLYTTGDYVGRNLWHRDEWDRVWDRQEFGEATVAEWRRERCLGAGTHTKYWESSDVAEELDALIAGEGAHVVGALHPGVTETYPLRR